MCGICGFASSDPRALPLKPAMLRAMCDVIAHRGPDDEGQLIEPGVALGMRRLSILDLETGAQPISNEDETVWTVFNGEIYNFRELRARLFGPHRPSTQGDTETIVHLYEELGAGFVEQLRGMFAIAVWDRPRRRLVLTRDRMGVKPLYVAEGGDGLAFASEVKCLIAGGVLSPSLDPLAAELFLAFGYVPGPRTLFAGVRKLLPGTTIVWQDGKMVSEEPYWLPELSTPKRRRRSWKDDQEELLALLRKAVRSEMVSDVPLGVMLSGGLDSSLVTALMAEASDQPVKTFSIGFANHGYPNELADARRVAHALGTDHHELLTQAETQPEMLDDLLWQIEEPVADLSMVGFWMISRLARQSVKVALSGQGADEILGGYRKHQVAYGTELLRRLPAPLRAALRSSGRILPVDSTAERGMRALMTNDPAERLLAMSRVLPSSKREAILEPDFRVPLAEAEIRNVISQHVPRSDISVLTQTLYLDTRLALADQNFLYFDKMSMATSLEVRVPFADHDLVSFCLSLPDRRRIWLLRRKEVLRRASNGLVTDHVLSKRKQGFFRSSFGPWLGSHRDFVREILQDERTRARHQFDQRRLARLIADSGTHGIKLDQQLFCILLLELWQRMFIDHDEVGMSRQPTAMAMSAPPSTAAPL
jgi:asparagine synthase (glutamine-hydrolysing)